MIRQIREALESKRRIPRWPRAQYPRASELQYRKRLNDIVRRLEADTKRILLPILGAIVDEANSGRPEGARLDDAGDAARRSRDAIARMRRSITEEYGTADLERIANQTGRSVSELNRTAIQKGWKRVAGVDVGFNEPYLAGEINAFVIRNVSLIQSIPERYLNEVEGILMEGVAVGTRVEDLTLQIRERFDVTESRARLLARDQVGKLNGQLNKLRQNELGVGSYIWRTSLDERVRESHLSKEGNKYQWSDPPADTGHPGEDPQCRCTAEPDLDAVLDE